MIVSELNKTAATAALAPVPTSGQSEGDQYASDVDALLAGLTDGMLV